MTTVDISRMGNLLNMSNVFSLYVEQLFASADRSAQNRMSEVRRALLNDIRHFSYQEVNSLLGDLTQRTSRFSVLTRNDMETALEKASPYHVLVTAALVEDEGQHEAMLYLLCPVKTIYKGKELLIRFQFIDNADNN